LDIWNRIRPDSFDESEPLAETDYSACVPQQRMLRPLNRERARTQELVLRF